MYLGWIILILVIVFLIFVCFLVFLQRKKRRGLLVRSMELSLFLVTLPQEIVKEKEREFSLEDYLKNAEHFYSSLAGIQEKSFLKRFYLAILI